MPLSCLQRLFVLVALAVPGAIAHAAPATYVGSAPVKSQAEAERGAALKTALANVVIEQTGDAGILARPDVAAAVAQADRYVLQYSYSASSTAAAPLTLTAQFDSAAVDGMLAQLGLRAATPAASAGTPAQVKVWIGQVRNAEDWLRLSAYLSRSGLVRSARPLQAHGEAVLMQLDLAGDLAHFLAALASGPTLALDERGGAAGDADATLILKP